jgi:hypothetical protein
MSTTTVDNAPVLVDYGSTFGSGTATHHLTLYRADSGALVFGSGTIQWPWGLDPNYDDVFGRGGDPADPRMQQATVNLLADMNVQPETLQSGLVAATASTDAISPTSTIASPAPGTSFVAGIPVTVTGTASDSGGGLVGGVEVSVDGGVTWHPAEGRENWSYTWTPISSGPADIQSRAVDDSGNLELPTVSALAVTTTSVPEATVGVPYAATLTASGGTAPYTWSLLSGTLPEGLSLATTGEISGTATTAGTASFTVQVADAADPAQTASQALTLTVTAATLQSIAVAPASASIAAGESQAFSATGTYSDATTQDLTAQVTWTSGDPTVATIAATGLASGVGAGTTTITATLAGVTSNPAALTVTAATLQSIAVAPASASIAAGESQAFSATGTYSDATTQDLTAQVTWTSADTAVATIDTTGLASGVGAGTTAITATLGAVVSNDAALTVTATALPGLVAAYSFDEGAGSTVTDMSGNGHTGTINGAVWVTGGRFGQALSFDGTNDWVTVDDANDLDLTTGMTVSAWVNPTVSTKWRTVILKEQTNGLAYALYGNDNSPRPAAYVNTGRNDLAARGVAALPTNTWTHLSATYDGASLRLYVNGVQVGSRSVSGAIVASSSPLRIGGNAVWGDEFFAGLIDEVRIYDRALSASEIQSDRDTPVSSP